jgi:hypothetical protein
MRDLELWRRLETGEVSGLARELEALAVRPLAARAPFLGAVARLTEHAEPALRAAAGRSFARRSRPTGPAPRRRRARRLTKRHVLR